VEYKAEAEGFQGVGHVGAVVELDTVWHYTEMEMCFVGPMQDYSRVYTRTGEHQ
jgi:hypothetical protein